LSIVAETSGKVSFKESGIMSSGVLESGWRTAPAANPELGWTWESRSCLEEARPVVEFLAAAMAREGYPDPDIFEMRLALQEALDNAIRHGNRGDPAKLVRVFCDVDGERVLVEVHDQGSGFDPDATEGHGLATLHQCTSWMQRNDCGNAVTLCKYRSEL
jgi:serine/threonine-protein kinase RsbW